jgi:tetratricopeptide (TPR) repeat protein
MSEYGKTLGENQIKMLMACEQTKNPLFLRSVLEEVRVWGKYELLTDQMASYLRKETIGELFDAILSRLEDDFNTVEYPNLVQDSMRALWCSYAGLSEDELHNHLGCPRCIFSGLYLSIRENLTNRNGRLYFFHDYLKQTVEKKYLNDSENKITTHIKIATNFGESLLTDIMETISTVSEEYKSRRKRCLLEVLWQLSYCQQYSLLNLLLSLPSVTQLLYEICKVNLFKLWRVSCPKGIKRLAAQNYIRECSWLLFQEYTSYVEDDVVIINPFVDEHVDSLISANLKGLVDRIVMEERKIMSEWTLSARVTMVKLISNVLVQSAEFLEGSQLLSMALQSCESEEERIGIIAEQAKVCLILSQFSKGIELCEPIVKSMQQECIPSVNPKRHKVSSSYYDVMYALAKLYSSNGQYPAADPLFRKVLDHRISVDGENRPRTADVLSDIARHKFLQKYYVDALDLSQQVLAIRKVTTGERTPSFIAAIRDIGMLHHDLGEYDKAERYFTNALDVTEIVFGTDHPSVADVLNDLAVAMYMKNRKNSEKFGEIIATYERALSIRIASYGNMHKDVANTLNHMANVYRTKFDLGDTEAISRAISLYNRAREIKETNLHPMHPEVLLSRSNIANILLMTGMFSEAAVEHEAILGLRQKVHGIDNIQNATSMKNCGLAHMGLNNWQKSLQYHLDALRIRKAGLGDLHPKTVESNACVGDVYAAMGNSAKAIEHYKVAMDAWNEVQGDGNSDSARAMVIIKKLENGELVSEKLYCFL